LACPARFERATYALEEFVATGMYKYFNVYNVKWLCVINCAMHNYYLKQYSKDKTPTIADEGFRFLE
jgi:hypothetical protein